MLTIKFVNNIAVAVVPFEEAAAFWQATGAAFDAEGNGYQNRNDWKSWEAVYTVARELTESTGVAYMPIDKGHHVSPRFDVIKAPAIGDEVSKSFNGDYYPVGTIKSISASGYIITTTTGERFFRHGKSGRWVHQGWVLVPGHTRRLNREF